jgi:hypothetical protein
MDLSWIEATGKLSLYLFLVLIAAALVAIAFRTMLGFPRLGHATEMRRPHDAAGSRSSGGRFVRFFFEYVGNLSLAEHEGRSAPPERRRRQHTRALMNQIAQAMKKREVSRGEREELLEELRRTIRAEEYLKEVKDRGIPAEEQHWEAHRRGLAERISALLVDLPPEMVARIEAGLMTTISPGDSAEDQE